jgi:hypothetical protein
MTRATRGARRATGLVGGLLAFNTWAADITRADIEAWVAAGPGALPAVGATIGPDGLEQLRGLVPPGYLEHFNHPSVSIEIEATANYQAHPDYVAATEANAGKTTLAAAGGVENYTAGRPFDPERFDDVSPGEAGLMAAWDNVYRWQYYGYKVDGLEMIYVLAGGGGATGHEALIGGGKVDRSLGQEFHRVYLNHLPMLADSGYRVDAAGSDTRHFKDYISFLEPFDVAGTTFVVERSLDANEEDQVNSYLPSQRRVRRLSAKERADNFMGSNFTLDDFEGFSGRVMDYQWTYLGQRQVLAVTDSREERLRFGGELSDVPLDRWQVRPTFVVELKPRWEGHPMSAKLLFIDQETLTGALALLFDREGRLWRIILPFYQRQQPDASTPERALETSMGVWRGSSALDLKAGTATVVRCKTPTEFPTMTKREIERIFSLSRLTEGR